MSKIEIEYCKEQFVWMNGDATPEQVRAFFGYPDDCAVRVAKNGPESQEERRKYLPTAKCFAVETPLAKEQATVK